MTRTSCESGQTCWPGQSLVPHCQTFTYMSKYVHSPCVCVSVCVCQSLVFASGFHNYFVCSLQIIWGAQVVPLLQLYASLNICCHTFSPTPTRSSLLPAHCDCFCAQACYDLGLIQFAKCLPHHRIIIKFSAAHRVLNVCKCLKFAFGNTLIEFSVSGIRKGLCIACRYNQDQKMIVCSCQTVWSISLWVTFINVNKIVKRWLLSLSIYIFR